jgi:hypothetical protein
VVLFPQSFGDLERVDIKTLPPRDLITDPNTATFLCLLLLSASKSGRPKAWLKIKNPKAPAAMRATDGTF